jgi:hypothetical protein
MMRQIMIALALFAAGLGSAASLRADTIRNTPGRFAPRDECARISGTAAFRAALSAAVRRRNVDALTALASDDVKLDFGGGAGKAELRKRLRGKDGPELWRELTAMLSLGCSMQSGNLVLPWFNGADLGDIDPFEVLLVTGSNVPLYARPSASLRPVARLSWQLVKPLLDDKAVGPLQHVQLVGTSTTGYIEHARLRSQVSYRLIAQRVLRRGQQVWRFNTFIAGD